MPIAHASIFDDMQRESKLLRQSRSRVSDPFHFLYINILEHWTFMMWIIYWVAANFHLRRHWPNLLNRTGMTCHMFAECPTNKRNSINFRQTSSSEITMKCIRGRTRMSQRVCWHKPLCTTVSTHIDPANIHYLLRSNGQHTSTHTDRQTCRKTSSGSGHSFGRIPQEMHVVVSLMKSRQTSRT